jgi:hypothetical protein
LIQPTSIGDLIRIGSKNDGGYAIPAETNSDLLISFGLGDDWKFENEMLKKKLIKNFYIYDHTVDVLSLLYKTLERAKTFYKLKPIIYRSKVFLLYFIDFTLLHKNHIRKEITGNLSNQHQTNLHEIVNDVVAKSRFILKVDIEGAEYKIIDSIVFFSKQIDLLIIEFHGVIRNYDQFEQKLQLLLQKFLIVHVHANNFGTIDKSGFPDVCEITFTPIGKYKAVGLVAKLPIDKLDSPSSPTKPEYSINFERPNH